MQEKDKYEERRTDILFWYKKAIKLKLQKCPYISDMPGPLSQHMSEDGMEIMEPNKAYGMHDAPGNKNVRVQVPVYPNEAYFSV